MAAILTNSIVDVPGIKIGHATDLEAITGCTVVLCEKGAVAGVDQRGGGPGTRETDLLKPINNVQKVHAVMLSGGSAFGLDSASGAMKYLEENNIGYPVGPHRVPIVPAAILFDLFIGDGKRRPDAEMGYQACLSASSQSPKQGSVGAGTGATVGKILGIKQSTKSGIGTASIKLPGGTIFGAIIAVNAIGDVVDPETNQIIAGLRSISKGPIKIGGDNIFANTLDVLGTFVGQKLLALASRSNTVIGVVATNAKLDKAQATRVAQMAQNGVVRTITPANTMHDGDTIFTLATGEIEADVSAVGAIAAEVMSEAILAGVKAAKSAYGFPGYAGE
jgi:L-aminopeptidase/D-esterase-like protein